MDTLVNSGGFKVVSAGSFTTFDDRESIILLTRGEEEFNISISFKDDGSLSQPNMKMEGVKDIKKNAVNMKLELINFNNTLPTGFTDPLAFGNFDNGDKVYLQINARKIGNNTKRHEVNYTIYLEEKKK